MMLHKDFLGAEVIKLKRRAFWLLHFILPIAGAVIVMFYYRISSLSLQDKFNIYMTIVSAVYPVMIAIATTLSFRVEEENNFYLILSAPDRKKVLVTKLLILYIMGCVSAFLAILLFPFMIGKCYSVIVWIKIFMLICIPNLMLYAIHIFLFLRFGKNLSVFAGICGTLLAMVFLTGLGDGIWKYVPWCMGTRASNLVILDAGAKASNDFVSRQLYLQDFKGFPISCFVETIFILIFFFLWIQKWEGRKVYE